MKKILPAQKNRIILLVVLALVIAFFSVFLTFRQTAVVRNILLRNRNSSLESIWKEGDYTTVFNETSLYLKEHPLDQRTLLFQGLSAFYLSLKQISQEEKDFYIDHSVYALRQYIQLGSGQNGPIVHYYLGKAYLYKGFYYSDMAIYHLMDAFINDYRPEDIFEYLAEAYSLSGDYQRSLDYFRLALKSRTSVRIYMKMGEIFLKIGDSASAIEYYNKSLNVTKDQTMREQGLFKLAHLYYDRGELGEAEKSIKEYLKFNDSDPEGYFLLGEIYFSMGENKMARRQWHITARLDPHHKPALHRLYD